MLLPENQPAYPTVCARSRCCGSTVSCTSSPPELFWTSSKEVATLSPRVSRLVALLVSPLVQQTSPLVSLSSSLVSLLVFRV